MAKNTSIRRIKDGAELVLPKPVQSWDFSGQNVVHETEMPLQEGVLVTSVKRDAASLSFSGLITASPETEIEDLHSGNVEEVANAIHTTKATITDFFYPEAHTDRNLEFTVFIINTQAHKLYCRQCRLSDLDFDENETTAFAVPYTITFTVPLGVMYYSFQ